MNCESIRNQFSSYLDGELASEQSRRVERHLSDCQGCHAQWLELQQLDARLQGLAVPQDLESRIVAAVGAETDAEQQAQPAPPPRGYRKQVVAAVIGLAAMIGLLAVWLRPNMPPVDVPPPLAAVVVRSIGNVQVRAPDAEGWSDVDGPHHALPRGSRIKTPQRGGCEVETATDAQLRLDANTEMVVHGSSHMQVLRGQVWCQAAPQQPLTLGTRPPADTAAVPDVFVCPAASEMQVRVDQHQAAEVGTEPVRKAWQLPLLALPGSDQGELSSLVETLLANVGHSKMQFMNADQIRALGPRGAIPLLMYVREPSSSQQPAVRRQAMQLAAEVADDTALTMLDELLADPDPQIRRLAEATVERLSVGSAR
ncbi:zf-HC2 domain-containing protein [Roseimaritima ulvae]|uniref:Putative zinc-finger domain-containing protein n=1 Tax=Roseimaritima ulvae TaxID=980254 RepID=A0A5B9QMX8_9BACT|nr:zf-HC2 domain-containing protein [Roseimaritima ulvae]QEG38366.1 hypothetical protein UC8_03230 [Roseimaritima ulvae]